jgi:DNA-binding MarR family transcriptional regulator
MNIDARTPKNQPHSFTSQEARSSGFLRIPLAAIRELGQPAQTLAGLIHCLKQDGASTFRRLDLIARAAGLKKCTVIRHLITLETQGLIVKHGRQKRRTVSYGLPGGRDWFSDGFICLPCYATAMPWSRRLVLSWVILRCENRDACQDSVSRMVAELGLDRRSVQTAIRALKESGFIDREQRPPSGSASTYLRGGITQIVGAEECESTGRKNARCSGRDNSKKDNKTTNEACGFVGRIGAQDLDDLPALHRRLVASGAIPRNDHGTVCYYGLVAHANRVGLNKPAMLAWLLRRQLWHHASDADIARGHALRKQQRQQPLRGGQLQSLASILETIRS